MPEYRKPTPGQVDTTLLKIPTYQLRRVFYEGLQNPRWVRPLLEAGAFANPPEPEITEDGYIRDTYWPELSYLIRIAREAPDDVVEVMLQLEESTNPWVGRALIEIANQVPAKSSARLKPILEKWAEMNFGWRTEPRSMVTLAIHLLEGGEARTGRWLANVLFEPQASDDKNLVRRPTTLLSEHWYDEQLPRIVPALGENSLKALVGWMRKFLEHSRRTSNGPDLSALDRLSIDRREGYADSREDALVDAIRDVAITSISADPSDTVEVLLRGNVKLLRKIALYVIGEVIRRDLGGEEDTSVFANAAKQLLSDPESYDTYLRVEYAQLARAAISIDPSVSTAVEQFLARAFSHDLAWLREEPPHGEGVTDCEREKRAQENAERYRHHWLSAIGNEVLPEKLSVELNRLNADYGQIAQPLEPIGRVTSWIGPSAHTNRDEMMAMEPAELVRHLAGWRDKGVGWGSEPSHEGQGRELSALLTTHPLALSGVAQLGQKLRPTYLRAILEGWEAALKADLILDWLQVADLIEYVLKHQIDSSFPVEGDDFDDDKDYGPAKSAAVGLLEELLKTRESIVIPLDDVERFVRLLVDCSYDEDAWVKYDEYKHQGSEWDPLTHSLNWRWPSRIRALVVVASSTQTEPWRREALKSIECEMVKVDRHGACHAVLGQGFGQLLKVAPDWIQFHLPNLVGDGNDISVDQQVVLTTALLMYRYNYSMYTLLTPAMLAAIDIGDTLVAGWRGDSGPLARIGEWAIDAFILGHADATDPVLDAFFNIASAAVRGEALGNIAWAFFRANEVEDGIRDRFAWLWDERMKHVRNNSEDVLELQGIHWLCKGEVFSPKWWLPRLRDALSSYPALSIDKLMIGEELARASAADPRIALDVLKLLMDGRDEDVLFDFHLSKHAIPLVLANAMRSSDPTLRDEAKDYMNTLGARGHLTLDSQVREAYEGKVGVDDIDDR